MKLGRKNKKAPIDWEICNSLIRSGLSGEKGRNERKTVHRRKVKRVGVRMGNTIMVKMRSGHCAENTIG